MSLEQLLKAAARQLAIPYETVLKDYAIGLLAREDSVAGSAVIGRDDAAKKETRPGGRATSAK